MKPLIFPLLLASMVLGAGLDHACYGLVLRYEGSPAIGKFIELANQHYGKSTFMTNVKTKSQGGEESVLKGTSDIGGVADEPKKSLLEAGALVTLIGRDAVAVIVNENNPLSELTVHQLRDIFSGKIKNWKELGGPDMDIEVLITSAVSATHDQFKRIVMDGREYKAKVVEPDPTILLMTSKNKGAIGFTSMFLLKDKPEGVKAIRPNGQDPSASNSNNPLSRPLYLVTKNPPRPEVKEFIDWALSEQGQNLVKTMFQGAK
jgi:phosphate transport system substrate-binding protein